jgi:uncharacterized membrane protein YbhN (UPF0104 family)
MDDEQRSVTTIFWLVLAFALSVLFISIGTGWTLLQWLGYLDSGQLWPSLLLVAVAMLGAVVSFAAIVAWMMRQARS